MTDTIGGNAVQQLRSVYDRWLRLEEDKAAISEDLRDLFAEAKGNGYDTKALRVAFRKRKSLSDDAGKVLEHDAIVDTYMAALDGTNYADARAHPRIARELPAPPAEAPEALSESVDPVAGARGGESAGTDREAAGTRPVPSVRAVEPEQQRNTAGVTAGETAPNPRAKASEGNGATGPVTNLKRPADSVAGEASRLSGGRTPDPGRAGETAAEGDEPAAGESPAPIHDDEPDIPAFLDRRGP